MNSEKRRNISIRYPLGLALIVLFGIIWNGCQDDVREWEAQSEQMVITEYVYNNPEQFTEFGIALQLSGVENLLKVRGPYTLLLPTDEAMLAYYSRLGVSSCYDIDLNDLTDMVYNHVFKGPISTGTMGLGTLPYKNGLDDYVASDLPGIDILINKKAIIIKRDIQVSNGYVHHIDYVLEPIVKSIYEVLSEDSGYSIFKEGLDLTGFSDTLQIISFPYGQVEARTRYTLLAVPDTLYHREGINDINDLIKEYATGDDYTDKNNGLYSYMEYHCLSGSNYFSDFTPSDIYYLITYDNYLNIRVEEDFKINKTDSNYTGFYFDQSNIPAKNGAIHTINTQLPYAETEASEIVFQTTDFFDLQQGPYYLNYYQRFYDGENQFENLKWDAEYLLYYTKPAHHLMDDDGLNLNGHFWVEITTPKIRAGKYDLSTFMFFGDGFAKTNCFVDGVFLAEVDPSLGSWGGDPLIIGEVEFEETKEHTIKLQTIVPGGMFWDRVVFTPK